MNICLNYHYEVVPCAKSMHYYTDMTMRSDNNVLYELLLTRQTFNLNYSNIFP